MKRLNKNLLQNLITSDFFILQNTKLKDFNNLNIKTTFNLHSLNIVGLNKSLKQFIRLLYYVKRQQSNHLFFMSSNKQHEKLLNYFISANIKKSKLSFTNFSQKKENLYNTLNFFISLEMNLYKNNIFKILNDKNIFLINEINSNFNIFDKGTYKIFNSLTDIKKLLFLIIIINSVFKK